MLSTSRPASMRHVVALSAAVLLTFTALLSTSAVANAGKPEPTISVVASCTNDSLGGGRWSPIVDLIITASYKGRWVDFEWSASVDSGDGQKGWPVSRWDARKTWTSRGTFFHGEPATVAHVIAWVTQKGVPVGDPFVIDALPCTAP